MTMILNNNQPVTTEAQLNAAIAQANGAAAGSGALQIELGGNIALSTALTAISLKSGVTLDIAGGASVLDGGGQQQGLFVYSGVVTIENLTVQNMLARGTNGGAGLGGGLFVADDAANGAAPGAVTLTNVSFNHDSAVGGDGGGANGGYGGGGANGGYGGGGGGFDAGSGVALGGGFGDGGGGGGSGYGAPNPPGGSTGGNPGGPGGNGGFGGGGGGGGGGWWFAAPGGGGYAGFGGGNGGGGGHGAAGTTSNGRGAGNGGGGGGGGGLGAGGDIFVQQGASLTIGGNSSLSAGSVAGGAGGVGAGGAPGPQSHENGGGPGGTGGSGSAGAAFGNGIFLQGNQSVTFAPGAGQTETISGVIADQTGSGGSGANAGAGSIVVDGPGTLALSAANTFTGGITIEQGALELTAPGVAGSGAISFAANPGEVATLVIDPAATPANGQIFTTTIADFGDGDAIDLPGLGYGYASSATLAGDVLTVTSNQQTLYFTLSDPGATKFYVHNDGANHVLVNDIPSLPSTNASWAGASADWDAASAWKGGVVANGFSTNATIAVAGGYVVRVAAAESFALQNLTLDNAKATLALAGN